MIQAVKPYVLLFNMTQDTRSKKIEDFLHSKGVIVRYVLPREFAQPIGALLQLPGFSAADAAHGLPFSDEMLLMSGFDQALLQDFLGFFSREGIRRVALKAMLTPSNASWSAYELHRHLSAEHAQLARLRK